MSDFRQRRRNGSGGSRQDRIRWRRRIARLSGSAATDSLYDQVVFLADWQGTNGDTSYTEQSSLAQSGTFVNQADISSDQSKFGTTSLYGDGTGDQVNFPHDDSFDLADNDFTIETHIYWTTAGSATSCIASHFRETSNNRGWHFTFVNGNIAFYFSTTGSDTNYWNEPWIPSTGQWYHVAVTRAGDSLRTFVDGVQIGSTRDMAGSVVRMPTGSQPLRIGNLDYSGDAGIAGYLENTRITIGTARYVTDFTPPTGPFGTST